MSSLFSGALLMLAAASAPAPATGRAAVPADVRHFIQASERCAQWHSYAGDAPTAAIAAATREACAPLPQQLAALHTAYAADPAALHQLDGYDSHTGLAVAALPKRVVALLARLDQCGFESGEVNGDGSAEDQATAHRMDALDCGDGLVRELQALRRQYRDDPRIGARLSAYEDDGTPIAPVPADVEAYETQSGACAAHRDGDCAALPTRLAALMAKYRDQPTAYPQHCVWDEQHCYDRNGLPATVEAPSDPNSGKPLRDARTGAPVERLSPRTPAPVGATD